MKHRFLHIISFAIVFFAISLWNACTYEKGKPIAPVTSDACDTAVYKYSGVISDIIQTNCAIQGCHDGSTGLGGVTLTSYEEVKAKVDDNRLIARMLDLNGSGGQWNGMPQSGKLPDTTLAKVQQWITEGSCP